MVCQWVVVQSLSCVQLFVTPWTAAHQASLSITISRSLLKFMSTESVMLSNHLIPLLSPSPPAFNLSQHRGLFQWVRWPKSWSFSVSISLSNEYSVLISFRIDWFDLLAVQETLKGLLQHHCSKHQFFSAQPSSWSSSHICTWPLEKPSLWVVANISLSNLLSFSLPLIRRLNWQMC